MSYFSSRIFSRQSFSFYLSLQLNSSKIFSDDCFYTFYFILRSSDYCSIDSFSKLLKFDERELFIFSHLVSNGKIVAILGEISVNLDFIFAYSWSIALIARLFSISTLFSNSIIFSFSFCIVYSRFSIFRDFSALSINKPLCVFYP